MPRKCSICTHPDRDAIDLALVGGEPLRGISRTYSVSEDSLTRHNASHLPAALIQSRDAAEVTRADSLLANLQQLQQRTLAILSKAEKSGELRTALTAIAQARANLELVARLLGQLQEQTPTVNVLVAHDWLRIRTAILVALDHHPEAKSVVISALERIENVGA